MASKNFSWPILEYIDQYNASKILHNDYLKNC